jgi:hypothetical protein
MRMKVGVSRGRGQYSWLNFHMNPHLWLVDIMWSTRVFVLSLTSDMTEIQKVNHNIMRRIIVTTTAYTPQTKNGK